MDIKLIKTRIKKLCEERNWSWYRLAKECNVEQGTFDSITKEKNMPSLYTLEKICNAFGISLSDFFDDEIFQQANTKKPLYLSLWNSLSKEDREKVLIYMSGLSKKEILEDIKNELQ